MIRRQNLGRAGSQKFRDGLFFAGAGNDLQIGANASRGEHDVHVLRVGRDGSDKSAGLFDAGLTQTVFRGSVSDDHWKLLVQGSLGTRVVLFDEDAILAARPELPSRRAPHAAGAADDVMTG